MTRLIPSTHRWSRTISALLTGFVFGVLPLSSLAEDASPGEFTDLEVAMRAYLEGDHQKAIYGVRRHLASNPDDPRGLRFLRKLDTLAEKPGSSGKSSQPQVARQLFEQALVQVDPEIQKTTAALGLDLVLGRGDLAADIALATVMGDDHADLAHALGNRVVYIGGNSAARAWSAAT